MLTSTGNGAFWIGRCQWATHGRIFLPFNENTNAVGTAFFWLLYCSVVIPLGLYPVSFLGLGKCVSIVTRFKALACRKNPGLLELNVSKFSEPLRRYCNRIFKTRRNAASEILFSTPLTCGFPHYIQLKDNSIPHAAHELWIKWSLGFIVIRW